MKQKKLLTNGELLGISLIGLLSVIMGGWTVIPLAMIASALVGVAASEDRAGITRAGIIGFITSVIIAALAYARNVFVAQLPKQESVPAAANTLTVFAIAVLAGTLTALIIAFFRAQPNQTVKRVGLLGFLAVCAIAFPFYDQQLGLAWAGVMVVALIYMLQALGLNIVAGYSGLLDLGYVAFFAIGGYTAAFLSAPSNAWGTAGWDGNLHVPFWLLVWVAAGAAAVFGLILGAPTLPLRGDYLAIVTLGFGEIVPIVFKNLDTVTIFEPISRLVAMFGGNFNGGLCLVGCGDRPLNITNGTQGLNPIDAPQLPQFFVNFVHNTFNGYDITFRSENNVPWYFLILFMLVVSAFFIARLRKSRIGRAFVAMREDELAASAMGVPIVRTKLTAFTIGALFSGFAGAFYASKVSFISPDAFDFSVSVIVLCMVILGGSGNIAGVILGGLIIKVVDLLVLDKLQRVINGVLQATVFTAANNDVVSQFWGSLLDTTQYKLMLFGIILVVMMLVRPQGLIPESSTQTKGN